MAQTTGPHTQHLARIHAHRRRVHAAAAQIDADAAAAVAAHYAANNGSKSTSGPPRPGNEAPNVQQ